MNDASWAALGAAIGGFLTGLFAWLIQRSKGGTDIEVAAIAEWQKLYAALSARVSALERELSETRRQHSEEMEAMRRKHEEDMRAKDDQIVGLQRQIAQESQSTAHLLSQSPVTPKDNPDGQ